MLSLNSNLLTCQITKFLFICFYYPLCSRTHFGQVGRYWSELVFRKPSAPFSKSASLTWKKLFGGFLNFSPPRPSLDPRQRTKVTFPLARRQWTSETIRDPAIFVIFIWIALQHPTWRAGMLGSAPSSSNISAASGFLAQHARKRGVSWGFRWYSSTWGLFLQADKKEVNFS